MIKALFLDRDGVINKMVYYDYGWDSPQNHKDILLVDKIDDVILWANKNNILVVEISNQPGVAKGKMTQKNSDLIENTVHNILRTKNVHIDKVYICPHHPNAAVSELKTSCDCRKPKPGLLLKASKDLKIDLTKSVFVGDKASDIKAGEAVGCKTIILIHDNDSPEKVEEAKLVKADYAINGPSEAIKILQSILK